MIVNSSRRQQIQQGVGATPSKKPASKTGGPQGASNSAGSEYLLAHIADDSLTQKLLHSPRTSVGPVARESIRYFDRSGQNVSLRTPLVLVDWSHRPVFIWTLINDDDDISIHYGPPNLYYSDDPFPGCFDNFVRPSRELLETSLKRMGFGEIRSLDLAAAGLPETFIGTRHVALLASRS